MFAMIDLAYLAGGIAIGIRYKDTFVSWWQHVVAWVHGAESYVAYLDGKAKAIVAKADAIKSAATTAAKS